jgi:hypothetical protein
MLPGMAPAGVSLPELEAPSIEDELAWSAEPVQDLSPDGVDRGLIRWMLSLTPTERLAVLQSFVDTFGPLRNGNTR